MGLKLMFAPSLFLTFSFYSLPTPLIQNLIMKIMLLVSLIKVVGKE